MYLYSAWYPCWMVQWQMFRDDSEAIKSNLLLSDLEEYHIFWRCPANSKKKGGSFYKTVYLTWSYNLAERKIYSIEQNLSWDVNISQIAKPTKIQAKDAYEGWSPTHAQTFLRTKCIAGDCKHCLKTKTVVCLRWREFFRGGKTLLSSTSSSWTKQD